MNLNTHTTTHAQNYAVGEHQRAFLAVSESRIDHLAQLLEPPSASIVLTGDAGSGKSLLAQQAVYSFAATSAQPVHQLLVLQFADLLHLSGDRSATPSHQVSDRILEALQSTFSGREVVIVALNIDNYDSDEAEVFEHLVRAQQLRFIGTAQQLVGAANLLSHDPAVMLEAVSPLTLDESGAFLARLLGVDQFAQQPQKIGMRQHSATRTRSQRSRSQPNAAGQFIALDASPGSRGKKIDPPSTSWHSLSLLTLMS